MKIDKKILSRVWVAQPTVDSMNPEAKADALEEFMMKRLNQQKFGLALKGLNEPGIALDAVGQVSDHG